MQTSRACNWIRKRLVQRLRGREGQSGQALVELAVTMPILLLILVGAIEMGRVAYTSIEVSNAALAGVQYGAQTAATAGDTTGIQTAAQNDAQNVTLGTTTVSSSCICSDGSASTCVSTDCSGSHIETILKVQTQAAFNPGFHLPGLATSYTLHGQAIQKVLQ